MVGQYVVLTTGTIAIQKSPGSLIYDTGSPVMEGQVEREVGAYRMPLSGEPDFPSLIEGRNRLAVQLAQQKKAKKKPGRGRKPKPSKELIAMILETPPEELLGKLKANGIVKEGDWYDTDTDNN